MPRPIISISGIRGIPGASLNPPDIINFTSGFLSYSKARRLVIGYDGRPSGAAIRDLVAAAAVLGGVEVVDLGLAPTPTVQLAVEHWRAGGGISITASHNPSEWNGLKFLDRTGVFLDAEQNAEFLRVANTETPAYKPWNEIGARESRDGFIHEHIERVLAYPVADRDRIRSRRFRVVVDAVNASGSIIVPEFLRRLDCTVFPLYCDASGIFPHLPEPLPVNLAALGAAVRQHEADLGVAVDPDADRLVLYDERGEAVGEEYTITTAVDAVLGASSEAASQSVVVNLSTTRAVDEVASKYGARVIRTPVGEINVVRKMLQCGAVIGGEGSGGVILPAVHPGRDSLAGLILVLHALAMHGGTLSSYRASLPGWVIRKHRRGLTDCDHETALSRAASLFADFHPDRADGVRIDFPDGWVHLRASNTGPIIRIIAEARTAGEADRLAAEVSARAFDSAAE